ncbi:Gfo/Idh/MocA family oxidoreductase [Flavitalea sp. BT771]|uniref:Gfo/Idh/MocA family protein n=1 Tax=Flavitalea sp. BT771 TaxID=3063329 RepID=UPI0026E25334|nr:Gfo/Idh/MocA family oxidoreductase [Flavitalea sp. BT771]MDO6429340.1 Gfo/Idh/MocA family oxidoreductase [Flavitalea sp. BT771]MDV6218532.1 Gfo/Idh/MocA family oxidoreductase [Flavitalea sp. BT771]
MSNRRNFLKYTGLVAGGLAAGPAKIFASGHDGDSSAAAVIPPQPPGSQVFNMCGYAAPKIETVRIGFIGLGNRGSEAVPRIIHIEGVDVRALCDIKDAQVQLAKNELIGTSHNPALYSGSEDEWRKLCERDDIDVVYIATPWKWHTTMAVYAMQHGKHVAVEVPAAKTLEECWELVNTSEKTKRHCIFLENECYDFFELLTLNMARQGFFGEIIHGEGAYIHSIGESLFDPVRRPGLWRLDENAHRNGNLYPTHGLGPVCVIMNINRGDKMEYLTSMSSNDFSLHPYAVQLAAKDPAYNKYTDKHFRGNMNTTTIRTNLGRTIMLQHDTSSPRVKSSRYLISGTKGTAQCDADAPRIATSHEGWVSQDVFNQLEKQYTPAIVQKMGEMARLVGGHGGMDFLTDWRWIDCIRNGLPIDHDVYDAALWSSMAPLSEWSVAHRSSPIDIPDFTRGAWRKNAPVDISIDHPNLTNAK